VVECLCTSKTRAGAKRAQCRKNAVQSARCPIRAVDRLHHNAPRRPSTRNEPSILEAVGNRATAEDAQSKEHTRGCCGCGANCSCAKVVVVAATAIRHAERRVEPSEPANADVRSLPRELRSTMPLSRAHWRLLAISAHRRVAPTCYGKKNCPVPRDRFWDFSDPVGQCFMELGELRLTEPGHSEVQEVSDVSVLLRAYPLTDKADLAIVVRRGKQREVVNYHRRAVEHLVAFIGRPLPPAASAAVRKAIARINRRRASM
jgi:hypothetical protein